MPSDALTSITTASSLVASSFNRPQFTGASFPGSGLDPDLPIPASLHIGGDFSLGRPMGAAAIAALQRVEIAIIGEALGENEDEAKRPFVGSTGADLRSFAKMAGFHAVAAGWFGEKRFYELPNVYIDNVVKQRPPDNDLDKLPPGALEFWKGVLRKQLSCGVLYPKVIIAVGGLALEALCGEKYKGITHWRGSVLPLSEDFVQGLNWQYRASPPWVIATVHPSYIQVQWKNRYQLIHDLKDALRLTKEAETYCPPEYNFILFPSIQEVRDFEVQVWDEEEKMKGLPFESDCIGGTFYTQSAAPCALSYDYETRAPFIRSVALSLRDNQALCIPFVHMAKKPKKRSKTWPICEHGFHLDDPYWEDPAVETEVWKILSRILKSKIPKIGQNYLVYDNYYSHRWGMPVQMNWLDSLFMHKCLQPELQGKLENLVSLYTWPRQSFYKAEGKLEHPDFTEVMFINYNCLDAATTRQAAFKIRDQLVAAGLWDVYVERYLSLASHLLRMSIRGIPWNEEHRKELKPIYDWLITGLADEVNRLAGWKVNIASHQQLKILLYGPSEKKGLALPRQYKGKGKDKKVTSDAGALMKLRRNYPRHATMLSTILKLKSVMTRKSNIIEARVDSDGIFRASFAESTETGRLASMENPFDTGRNAQNFERVEKDTPRWANMRNFFMVPRNTIGLPADDFWLLSPDYRQAEAMVVAWMANEERLINIFLSGDDVHILNAMMIFQQPRDKITGQMRYLGKKVAHGANYGLGPVKLIEIIMEETDGELVIEKKLATFLIESYHRAYPNIRRNYHSWVKEQLDRNCIIRTPPPFNRRRVFHAHYGSEELYMEGNAYVPQSVVVDCANQSLKELSKKGVDIRLQGHDSLTALIRGRDLISTWKLMKKEMTIPLSFYPYNEHACRRELIIPVDFSIGKLYGEMTELKKMKEEEVEKRLEELITK